MGFKSAINSLRDVRGWILLDDNKNKTLLIIFVGIACLFAANFSLFVS